MGGEESNINKDTLPYYAIIVTGFLVILAITIAGITYYLTPEKLNSILTSFNLPAGVLLTAEDKYLIPVVGYSLTGTVLVVAYWIYSQKKSQDKAPIPNQQKQIPPTIIEPDSKTNDINAEQRITTYGEIILLSQSVIKRFAAIKPEALHDVVVEAVKNDTDIRIVNFDLKEWYECIKGLTPIAEAVIEGIKSKTSLSFDSVQRTSVIDWNGDCKKQFCALRKIENLHKDMPNIINLVSETHIEKESRTFNIIGRNTVEQVIFFQHRDDGKSYLLVVASGSEKKYIIAPKGCDLYNRISSLCSRIHGQYNLLHTITDFLCYKHIRRDKNELAYTLNLKQCRRKKSKIDDMELS